MKKKVFSIERRGYSKTEVDGTINSLNNEIEKLKNEISSLKERLSAEIDKNFEFENKKQYIEDTIVNAGVLADSIVKSAKIESETILKQAYDEKAAVISETESKMLVLDEAKKDCNDSLKRVKYILESQIALLKNNMDECGK